MTSSEERCFLEFLNFDTPAFDSFVETTFPNSIAAGIVKNYTPQAGISLSNLQTLSQYYGIARGYYFPTLASAEALGYSADLPVMGTGVYTPQGTRNGYQWTVRPDYYFNQQKDHLFFYAMRADTTKPIKIPAPLSTGPEHTLRMP